MHRLLAALTLTAAATAHAAPTSVTLVGDLQVELGCAANWDPACPQSALTYDAADDAWQASFAVPGGNWNYKVALDGDLGSTYGINAVPNGDAIPLNTASRTIKFYYNDHSHWVTSTANAVIVTVPGDFQSEVGCWGDWQPDCLRTWLQDPDGDGVHTLQVQVPTGTYECKLTHFESWNTNYGENGIPNGPSILFTVSATPSAPVDFSYHQGTHVLSITVHGPPATLSLDPAALEDTVTLGDTSVRDHTVTLATLPSDTESAAWQTSADPAAPWLTESNASGTVSAQEPAALSVHVDPTGLDVGDYQATLRVAAPAAATTPLLLPVTLHVVAPASSSSAAASSSSASLDSSSAPSSASPPSSSAAMSSSSAGASSSSAAAPSSSAELPSSSSAAPSSGTAPSSSAAVPVSSSAGLSSSSQAPSSGPAPGSSSSSPTDDSRSDTQCSCSSTPVQAEPVALVVLLLAVAVTSRRRR